MRLAPATVFPRGHLVWGFQESWGLIRMPSFWKTKSHRSKIYLYLLPRFGTVKYRIDFSNIISKHLRMLKAKINLDPGFSLYDLEGKWAYMLLVPWKSLYRQRADRILTWNIQIKPGEWAGGCSAVTRDLEQTCLF